MTKYQPGMVLHGRKLIERTGDRRWLCVCEKCGIEADRHIDTLRMSKCNCYRGKVEPVKVKKPSVKERSLKDYSNTVIGRYRIHEIACPVQKNAGGGICWTGTCQACGAVKEGPIHTFIAGRCTSCDKIEQVRLQSLRPPSYTDGMNSAQIRKYHRLRRLHYSEREARSAALGIR